MQGREDQIDIQIALKKTVGHVILQFEHLLLAMSVMRNRISYSIVIGLNFFEVGYLPKLPSSPSSLVVLKHIAPQLL